MTRAGTYAVILSARAFRDLEGTNAWLVDHKPELAAHWLADIDRAAASLQELPGRCPRVAALCRGKRVVRKLVAELDVMLFEVDGDVVVILRVLHEGRALGLH